MILSPIATKDPLSVLPEHNIASTKISARRPGLNGRSTSTSSVPQIPASIHIPQTSKMACASSINMPSPPLTPYLGNDDQEGVEGVEEYEESSMLLRHSSSAPSAMSPLEMKLSMNNSNCFTFTSNLQTPSNTQTDQVRESYDYFVNMMEADYWKSVSTIRTTYFFDGIGRGGGFLAIPHIASHGNAKTNVICRLLEAWLTEKLVEPTISEESIPVLEDNIESSVLSIEQHLRQQDPKVWAGISKSFIHIRCGHVFMLDTCCDDETIVHLGADEFYQDYPLFVDVEIKMHCESNNSTTGTSKEQSSTELLIAFKNVANRNQSKNNSQEEPYVHHTWITNESASTIKRRQSQVDDQDGMNYFTKIES